MADGDTEPPEQCGSGAAPPDGSLVAVECACGAVSPADVAPDACFKCGALWGPGKRTEVYMVVGVSSDLGIEVRAETRLRGG